MANEYLKRTPTSNGNEKVWTLSAWIKTNDTSNASYLFGYIDEGASPQPRGTIQFNESNVDGKTTAGWNPTGNAWYQTQAEGLHRDPGNWLHLCIAVDTTKTDEGDGIRMYFNGAKESATSYLGTWGSGAAALNIDTGFNHFSFEHYINAFSVASGRGKVEYFDFFWVDGQSLGPDVFGFYKDGDGYMSSGTTRATDFKPGQWVPKKPSVIKNSINNSGGFGVNGFYLPMNDSSNFGADFHMTPNSVITLKGEDLPQPQNGAPTTSDAYVSQLRTDANAANLVLAVPGITGGQGSGYGDYSADIKGSGSNKTVTAVGNAGIAATASYYGSAMVFDGSGDYYTLPSSSDFNFGTGDYTIELWAYHTSIGSQQTLIGDTFGSTNGAYFYISSLNELAMYYNTSSGTLAKGPENGVKQDQWIHYAAVRKSGILTLFMNGVAVDTVADTYDLSVTQYYIGDTSGTSSGTMNGYIQDVRIYKGVAKYKGGFDVPKPYTPVGVGTWRAVSDTTANNFATLNTLYPEKYTSGTNRTFSNGNLTASTITNGYANLISSFGVNYGEKRYFEVRQDSLSGGSDAVGFIGIKGIGQNDNPDNFSTSTYYYGYDGTKFKYIDGVATISNGAFGATYTNGDIIGIAINSDGTVVMYKNGVSQGTIDTYTEAQYPLFLALQDGGSNELVTYSVNFGQNPTFSGNTTAGTNADDSGKGLFKYAPPSGHLALCEDNLPTPTIADPGDYMRTVLWEGDGNIGRSITGVGFKPDFVWIKDRGDTSSNSLFDSVRGAGIWLSSNSTGAEQTAFVNVYNPSFNDDGFGVGTDGAVNGSGSPYVAWCWKAGGDAVSNTDGTITSQVSANQTAGFSIISYTGNATSGATVGHGLAKTPKMVIVKERTPNTNNWPIYHVSLGNTKAIYLDLTNDAGGDFTGAWNNTTPTSSVITLGNSNETNRSGSSFIAYCWAEVEGFSKFGSYVGNGDADGSFIYCGFKPAWVLIKRNDNAAGGNWTIFDNVRRSFNVNNHTLNPNNTNVEETTGGNGQIDFLSNGFKCKNADAGINGSAGNYIFAAFAESPFKTANAK